MRVTNTQPNSESALMNEIFKLSDAGASVIQIRTREPHRTALTLRKNLLTADTPYREWDAVNGFRDFTSADYTQSDKGGDNKDFITALQTPLDELRKANSRLKTDGDHVHYFAYVNPHPFLANNPYAAELLQQYAAILPATSACVLLITSDMTLDLVPTGTILVADLPTPSVDELTEALAGTLTTAEGLDFEDGIAVDEEEAARISQLGLGLSHFEFVTFASIAAIEASQSGAKQLTADHLMTGIARGKTAVVRQSEILELNHPADINDVGGMHRLKDWITERADCFSDDAKEFGIEPPKGVGLVGIPGGGKSLVAKATASVLGVPLVRMDFARVFSKYVGDSEQRVRSALSMVEAMAPVVLFVDEIDKGLGGAGGGGDSGTSSRVLGSFLTWLQEYTAPVFTIVTANRVEGLPPELLRRGRFDAIFSVMLPEPDERKEVLAIHLRKRGRDISKFSAKELSQFVDASDRYSPAEIESAVKDALIMAYNDKSAKDLQMSHLVSALNEMVPMSKSHAAQIQAIEQWAAENAIAVNSRQTPATIAGEVIAAAAGRRMTRRSR